MQRAKKSKYSGIYVCTYISRAYLIEIAVSITRNLQNKRTEIINKYIELCEEIRDMCYQEKYKSYLSYFPPLH